MDYTEQTLEQETIFNGRVLTLRRDIVLLKNGSTTFREVVEHPGGAAVLATRPDGRILLVRQYRYAAGKTLLEIPAGKLEPGEDPASCAARELEEETGWRAGSIFELGHFYPTPGYDSEIIHLYQAVDLSPSHQHLDVDELLDVEALPREAAMSLIADGGIVDAKTVLALLLSK